MRKKLFYLIISSILILSTALFACKKPEEHSENELTVTDAKMTLEFTVGTEKFIFESFITEDMTYTYRLLEDGEKSDECFEVKSDGLWYSYEINSFGFWTRAVIEDPYKDSPDFDKEDFEPGEDGFYTLKPEKLGFLKDFMDLDMDLSDVRVKLNKYGLPDEMFFTLRLDFSDTEIESKLKFEYNTGKTHALPERFVLSYNIKISTVYSNSQNVYRCWVFENVACSFIGNEGYWLEIDAYGTYVTANWYNNQWNYHNNPSAQSTGYTMIEAMKRVNLGDFDEEEEGYILKSSKSAEYAQVIIPNANPDTLVLDYLRIKYSGERIVEMTVSSYFSDDPEETYSTRTLTFEYDKLAFEDLP